MKISLIAAVADNGIIGRNGYLPWRLKSDLRRFRELTMKHTVIVGRRTYQSIVKRLGHPLEGRRTIVVTRDHHFACECEVAYSLQEALARAQSDEEVFIAGGAELYQTALPLAERLYLTRVHANPEGDALFARLKEDEWQCTFLGEWPSDAENEFASTFLVYDRKQAPATFINLEYARHDEQRAVMERIKREGACPFCPENRRAGEVLEPLWRGKHWVLVPNRWPYEFITLHALAITERHLRFFHELTATETAELIELLTWAWKNYELQAYSIGIRCGEPHLTGATVDHLHVQLVVADPDTTKPGYERVRFAMGPKPPTPG
ncbi:MAG: dihydrofolate reductase [Candidatus Sungbacteria bacterium]|uniref:dihydrofolate reductase n=1 Tax=Candidatus Sungiibacteriota bacterium TaxID=2750080 RepID=A0A931SCB4_9BACT|nr:dihydrofolate reductase [Candidatus Sungbacteria bacterium]